MSEENKIEKNIETDRDITADVNPEVTEGAKADEVIADSDAEPKKNGAGSKIAASFKSRKFKGGAYALVLSVIVIAVFVVVNLMATELDISWDLTSDAKYSLTDETIDFINSIDDNLIVYYLCQDGAELDLFDKIMKRFETESSNITVTTRDPIKYPKFAEQYTDANITEHSVIVVNTENNRAKYIPYADMIVSELNYETYSYETTGLDVEGQIVSAIQYVVSDDLPVMYTVSGHNEATISTTMASSIAKENVETSDLSLLTTDAVPEDCDILLIYYPQYDYSAEEIQKLKDYMTAGGKILFLADINTSELPNLTGFLAYYGMELQTGYVVEGNSRNILNNFPYVIIPTVETHDITADIRNQRLVVMPVSAGIKTLADARSTITFTPILTTSDDSYSKTNVETTTNSKEDGDIDGPFNLGIEMSETYNGVTSQMIVYTSSYFVGDDYLSYNTYGNGDMFFNTLNYLGDVEVSVSVRTTSLSEDVITLTSSEANTLGIIYMVVIPLAIIGVGIFVVIRRKRRG